MAAEIISTDRTWLSIKILMLSYKTYFEKITYGWITRNKYLYTNFKSSTYV